MPIKDDLKNISSLVATMEEQLKTLESVNDSYIEALEFQKSCKAKIAAIKSEEEIDALTERNLYDYFASEEIDKEREAYAKKEESKDVDFLSHMKEIVKTIYTGIKDFERLTNEKNQLIKDANKITDDYFSYISSDEYLEKRKARLKKMREEIEAQEDSSNKRRSLRELDAMENADSLEFLYDHIREVGDKEIKNITDIFFHSARSKAVMDKFKSRMKRYGYKETAFQQFFNIEEKFLPEKYHVFNNLFLFNAMRFVSFSNPEDKADGVECSALLLKMHNLMNHTLGEKKKEEFITFIEKYLDQFESQRDLYAEKNSTAPGHPERIAADKRYEEKYRLTLITHLQNRGVDVDTNLETAELRKMLDDLVNPKKEEEVPVVEVKEEANEKEHVEDALEEADSSSEESVEEAPKATEDSINELLDKIENSEEAKELDDFAESLGGTLIPEGEKVEDEIKGYAGILEENKLHPVSGTYTYLGEVESFDEVKDPKSGDVVSLIVKPSEEDYKKYGKDLVYIVKDYVYDGKEFLSIGEDKPVIKTEETENASMVVPVETEESESKTVIMKGEEVKEEEDAVKEEKEEDNIDMLNALRYIDPYKCIYVQKKDNTYAYYEKDGVTLIEENIPEDDILRLLSSGSITKVNA